MESASRVAVPGPRTIPAPETSKISQSDNGYLRKVREVVKWTPDVLTVSIAVGREPARCACAGGADVGLQTRVHETRARFPCYRLFIVASSPRRTAADLLSPHPVVFPSSAGETTGHPRAKKKKKS